MKRVVIWMTCHSVKEHNDQPGLGYGAFFDWCREKDKTHKQTRCSGCGRWVIWTPRAAIGGGL